LLGLPILDTVGVMVQRVKEGRSPFVADKNHLHHKFLTMGLSHHEAVLVIYSLQATIVSLAYLLRWQDDFFVLGCYAVVAGLTLAPFMSTWNVTSLVNRAHTPVGISSPWLTHHYATEWLGRVPIHVLAIAVPAFLILSVFLPPTVPHDMGFMAGAICLFLIAGMALAPRFSSVLVRAGLYVGSTFVMYLSEEVEPSIRHSLQTPITILFLFLALLVMLTIRFNTGHRFQTTPLDYLMVFLALIIPILPEMRIGDIPVSVLTAKLLVLFFSFELLIHAYSHRVRQLGLVSLWLFLGLAIRGWWS
jgi:UDP-GlcNAc:undecaprenyl-phosphate GlcNAc-1-phosphate transferase